MNTGFTTYKGLYEVGVLTKSQYQELLKNIKKQYCDMWEYSMYPETASQRIFRDQINNELLRL